MSAEALSQLKAMVGASLPFAAEAPPDMVQQLDDMVKVMAMTESPFEVMAAVLMKLISADLEFKDYLMLQASMAELAMAVDRVT